MINARKKFIFPFIVKTLWYRKQFFFENVLFNSESKGFNLFPVYMQK